MKILNDMIFFVIFFRDLTICNKKKKLICSFLEKQNDPEGLKGIFLKNTS
jgi:hypothetical protein